MFEAGALFGLPTTPGGAIRAPAGAWVTLTVHVQLDAIVDLSELSAQALLDLSVQELTGDWSGYRNRSTATNVSIPIGTAPTRHLARPSIEILDGSSKGGL
jgi:hypothetical protein